MTSVICRNPFSDVTMMSQHKAVTQPAPMAAPLTAAMIGLGHSSRQSKLARTRRLCAV